MTETSGTAQPVLAWHGDPALKAEAVERMKVHAREDQFRQGDYIVVEGGKTKGCFHGCLTAEKLAVEQGVEPGDVDAGSGMDDPWRGNLWWRQAERIWGFPYWVSSRLDYLFEQFLLTSKAGAWAVAVTEAIPVGADLSGVERAFGERGGYRDDCDGHALMLRLLAEAPVPDAASVGRLVELPPADLDEVAPNAGSAS